MTIQHDKALTAEGKYVDVSWDPVTAKIFKGHHTDEVHQVWLSDCTGKQTLHIIRKFDPTTRLQIDQDVYLIGPPLKEKPVTEDLTTNTPDDLAKKSQDIAQRIERFPVLSSMVKALDVPDGAYRVHLSLVAVQPDDSGKGVALVLKKEGVLGKSVYKALEKEIKALTKAVAKL